MRICRICQQPIEGAPDASDFDLCGRTVRLGITVHDECLRSFQAEQAEKERHSPGRHFSSVPHKPTIRDWDDE